ncbi:hypothetical protein ACPVTF_03360 [Geobacillus icigianus]|uniref:hypothetical protein n=1 Tax=Geobacillus TaxID=129337 RepID=UPI000A4EEFB8|nr:hypothetical protein [Geobacillus sp. B4113_201601]
MQKRLIPLVSQLEKPCRTSFLFRMKMPSIGVRQRFFTDLLGKMPLRCTGHSKKAGQQQAADLNASRVSKHKKMAVASRCKTARTAKPTPHPIPRAEIRSLFPIGN